MTEQKSGENVGTEEKSFIREKMAQPRKDKAYYSRLILAAVGGLVLFGVVAGLSFAVVLHHMGVGLESASEDIPVSFERDNIPETQDSTPEQNGETEPEQTIETSASETETEETTQDDQAEDVLRILEELGKDGRLSEWNNASVYSAYDTARSSLVQVGNGAENGRDIYAASSNDSWVFGVIVAMSDYEAVVLCNGDALSSQENLRIRVEENEIDAVWKQQDSLTGIASLTINLRQLPDNIRKELTAISLGNSYNVKLSDRVLLAGNPLGVTGSLLAGNVTYVDKDVYVPDGQLRILYTDVPAVSGGSGILLNARGELVGWLDSHYTDSSLSQWQGALGISELKAVIEDLILGNDTASLGVTVQNISAQTAVDFGLPEGLYVTDVDSRGPAYEAGIQNGDIVVAINETELRSVRGLQNFLEDAVPGEETTVRVMRLGRDEYKEVSFQIKLGSR